MPGPTIQDVLDRVDALEATLIAKFDALNDLAVGDLNNISTSDIATELATYDAPTKAELDTMEIILVDKLSGDIEKDSYSAGDNVNTSFYANYWYGQTFTPQEDYIIRQVGLKLSRISGGLPGTITVSIRATDESGSPIGSDLVSGTIDGDALTEDTLGEWYDTSLGEGTLVSKDIKYAIIVRVVDGDTDNRLYWRTDSIGNYAGGNKVYSGNSGSTWTPYVTDDFMFRTYSQSKIKDVYIAVSKIPAAFTG